MRNARRCDYEGARCSFMLLVTNTKTAGSGKYEIEFVCALVGMHSLRLIRLQTIQTSHYVLALPESCFVKLFRVGAGVLKPIDEVVHSLVATITMFALWQSYHTGTLGVPPAPGSMLGFDSAGTQLLFAAAMPWRRRAGETPALQ